MKETNKSSHHLMDLIIFLFDPESPPRIAGGHRHFLPLLDTRGVTVWPVDVLNLKCRFYPSNLWFFVLQNSWNFWDSWFNMTTGLIPPPKKSNGTPTTKSRKVLFLKALNVHLCHPFEVGGRSWLEEQRQWWGLGARCAVSRMLRYLDWKSMLEESRLAKPFSWMEVCQFV